MTTTEPRPYSILIADDDPGSREALRDIVEPEGYRTVLAASGEEALDLVREAPVHLALFDVHMPRLSGLEALELLRQFDAVLPCILVTADPSEGLMRQAFRVRAYSVIPKPVSKNVVLYTVVRALVRVYGTPRLVPGARAAAPGPSGRVELSIELTHTEESPRHESRTPERQDRGQAPGS
jgi:CheY-like chemotaxis protein